MNSYIAYCDGGSRGNPGPSASASIVYDQDNKIIKEISKYIKINTNNVAEWQSLILALETAQELDLYPITIRMDSLLVISQIQDKWKVKTPHLLPLYKQAKLLINKNIKFEHVRREYNKEADRLVNEVLDSI